MKVLGAGKLKLIVSCLLILFWACSCGTNAIDSKKTEESIPLTQEHNYPETPYVDYSLTGLPEFVEDISECKDIEKQYVLPDGFLYEYQPVPSYFAVNQLKIAEDADGSVFNGCGYQDGSRIRGILEIGELQNGYVTGFIPVKNGDIIYLKEKCFNPGYQYADIMHTVFYDDEKQIVGSTPMLTAAERYFEIVEQTEDGYISAMKIKAESLTEEIFFIRLSLIGSGEQQIISINEPLVITYGNSDWVKTDEYVPADWYDEIVRVTEKVNSIPLEDESTTIKFIFASDMHLNPGSTTSYTEDIGKVSAEVMRMCKIPFYIDGGDSSTQSDEFMPIDFERNITEVLTQLSPIPQRNILLAVGNHDGATGMAYDSNGNKVHYRFQLNNAERSRVFFDWQRETNPYKHFDTDGTYYYLDDSTTKTRYIVLNSFWSQWEGNEEGYVPNIEHSFFHTPLYGTQQLKWLAEEALDMPPEYAAVIITHHATNKADGKKAIIDYEILQGIVDAFNNKTKYHGSVQGTEEWQSTSVIVNYENAYGEIIAVFSGHNHKNIQYDYFDTIPCINITTTGAYWDVRDESKDRVKGTSTEFAVDIVVIDRGSRKIYMNRLGAGENRVIDY